jgi:hypothetical protein
VERGIATEVQLSRSNGRATNGVASERSVMLNLKMRRGLHIAIALVAVFLLARPFDCFASGKFDRKAADCCAKGKCHQSADADPCCKASLTDGNHFVSGKAAGHSSPLLAVIADTVPNLAPPPQVQGPLVTVNHPPPLGRTTGNLPLLI